MTQRVAIVTGAMGGLGTAICQQLAKAGHKVVAAYHPQFDNKEEWLKEMAAAGFNDFVCVGGDVSVLEALTGIYGPRFLAAQHASGAPDARSRNDFMAGPVACLDGHFALTLSRAHFWRDALRCRPLMEAHVCM